MNKRSSWRLHAGKTGRMPDVARICNRLNKALQFAKFAELSVKFLHAILIAIVFLFLNEEEDVCGGNRNDSSDIYFSRRFTMFHNRPPATGTVINNDVTPSALKRHPCVNFRYKSWRQTNHTFETISLLLCAIFRVAHIFFCEQRQEITHAIGNLWIFVRTSVEYRNK